MILKATVEPMMMRDSKVVERRVAKIALTGTSQLGCTWNTNQQNRLSDWIGNEYPTYARNSENGRPLSRAKAKSCREEVVI